MHQNGCTQTSMVTLPQGSIIILKMTLTLKQKLWNIQSKTLQSHNSQQWWSTVLVYEQYPWPIYQPIVNLRQREGKKRGFMQSGSILPASAAPSILMSSTSSDQVPLLTHLKTDWRGLVGRFLQHYDVLPNQELPDAQGLVSRHKFTVKPTLAVLAQLRPLLTHRTKRTP